MIDPKSIWLITKTTYNILVLLIECAAWIGVVYFTLFTNSYIVPFFATTDNLALAREAKFVYLCCFVVLAFLTLLIGQQLAATLLSLCPGIRHLGCKPENLRLRIVLVIAAGLLFIPAVASILYPLLKALAWRRVFADAGRADLQEQAMALVVFMGISLTVGMLSLLGLSWSLVVLCWEAFRHWCRGGKKSSREEISL